MKTKGRASKGAALLLWGNESYTQRGYLVRLTVWITVPVLSIM